MYRFAILFHQLHAYPWSFFFTFLMDLEDHCILRYCRAFFIMCIQYPFNIYGNSRSKNLRNACVLICYYVVVAVLYWMVIIVNYDSYSHTHLSQFKVHESTWFLHYNLKILKEKRSNEEIIFIHFFLLFF